MDDGDNMKHNPLRTEDNPHTRQLKELREKRLAFFESKIQDVKKTSSHENKFSTGVTQNDGGITSGVAMDLRASMARDNRVKDLSKSNAAAASCQHDHDNLTGPGISSPSHTGLLFLKDMQRYMINCDRGPVRPLSAKTPKSKSEFQINKNEKPRPFSAKPFHSNSSDLPNNPRPLSAKTHVETRKLTDMGPDIKTGAFKGVRPLSAKKTNKGGTNAFGGSLTSTGSSNESINNSKLKSGMKNSTTFTMNISSFEPPQNSFWSPSEASVNSVKVLPGVKVTSLAPLERPSSAKSNKDSTSVSSGSYFSRPLSGLKLKSLANSCASSSQESLDDIDGVPFSKSVFHNMGNSKTDGEIYNTIHGSISNLLFDGMDSSRTVDENCDKNMINSATVCSPKKKSHRPKTPLMGELEPGKKNKSSESLKKILPKDSPSLSRSPKPGRKSDKSRSAADNSSDFKPIISFPSADLDDFDLSSDLYMKTPKGLSGSLDIRTPRDLASALSLNTPKLENIQPAEHLIANATTMAKLIEPDYESDYSELGLSTQKPNIGPSVATNAKTHTSCFSAPPPTCGSVSGPKKATVPLKPLDSHRSQTSSKSIDSLDKSNLEGVLGKEKLERLMRNIRESEWAVEDDSEEDKDTSPGEKVTNQFVDSGYVTQEMVNVDSSPHVKDHTGKTIGTSVIKNNKHSKDSADEAEDLGLTTHRPPSDVDESDINDNVKSDQPWPPPMQEIITDLSAHAKNYVQLVKETSKAKCAFTSDEIYAQAGEMPVSTDDLDMPIDRDSVHLENSHSIKQGKTEPTEPYKQTSSSAPSCSKPSDTSTHVVTVDMSKFDSDFTPAPPSVPKSRPSGKTPRGRAIATISVTQTNDKMLKKEPAKSVSNSPRTSSQKHIDGIKQHMENRKKAQEETLPPAVASYNNASLERYFNSIEKITRDGAESTISSENIEFDPVPEPDIGSCAIESLKVDGKNVTLEKVQAKQKSSQPVTSKGQKTKDTSDMRNVQDVKEQDIRLWLEKEEKDEQNGNTDEDNEDLYTKVTSVLSDMQNPSLTQRLKNLGIDFSFLKEKHRNIAANEGPSIISDTEINVDLVTRNTEDRNKVLPNHSVQDEVEVSKHSKVQISEPVRVEEKPLIHLPGNDDMTDSEVPLKLNRETGKVETSEGKCVKVCPECAEVNDTFVTWCVECGATLHGVARVPWKPKVSASPRWQLDTLPSPPKAGQNFRNRLEESLGRDDWKVKEECETEEDKFSILKRRECVSRGDHIVETHNDLRDSDKFEYMPAESTLRLPNALKNELSLDLRCSTDSALKSNRPEQNYKPENDIAKLAEEFHFEYADSNQFKASVPAELKAELSLNLRDSRDSCLPSQIPATKQDVENVNQQQEGNVGHVDGDASNREDNDQISCDEPVEVINKIGNDPPGPGGDVGRISRAIGPDDDDLVDDVPIDDSGDHEADDIHEKFMQKLMKDPRLRPLRPGRRDRPHTAAAIPQPSKSGNRPKSGRKRPQSASQISTVSKVRASLEAEPYQRHWASSSIAWGTYNHGELRTHSSLGFLRPSSGKTAKSHSRESSADGRKSRTRSQSPLKGRPWSAKSALRQSMPIAHSTIGGGLETPVSRPQSSLGLPQGKGNLPRSIADSAWNTYGKYLEMVGTQMEVGPGLPQPSPPLMSKLPPLKLPGSPRIEEGDFSLWLCLPDEIILYILSFLPHSDLASCSQTCTHFNRVASDDTLWRHITLKKKTVLDEWLTTIGQKQPSSLSLVQCRGDKATPNGLRELFRHCADSLKELNFTGCSRGHLTGDHILLHAASRCRNITHLDASWSNVNDNGVIALAESCDRLESVCLNGCQAITDDAVHAVLVKHGIYLRVLELFGCFNMTARAASDIGLHCKSLVTLNLGQCWKLTDVCVSQMSGRLGMVENLDLRGVKQMKDLSVHNVMRNCRHLTTLSLANCPNLTDASLAEIATFSPNIRSLDLCGCKKLGNTGARALAIACQRLEYLDMSSTGITHKGVTTIANYCNQRLEVVKLNFCKHINVTCLAKLAKHCKRLKKLYLYGVNGIRNIDDVRRENWNLWIEM